MRQFFVILFIYIITLTSFAQVFETPEEVKPLKVGEMIPDLTILSLDNSKKEIRSIISDTPSIVLFYRGGWCPYCSKHVKAVGKAKEEINEIGYQIIGITPDTPTKLNETIKKGKLGYKLFSDADTSLMQAMGIAYKAPERYEPKLANFSNSQNDNTIPVPSLYVLDISGTIIFQYSGTNYRERISTKKLIEELKDLSIN
jgi:peroxiredoxin